ncbi:hypothetical protein QWY20_05560 [Alkalimonas sp. MEB108]|uniref:DUF2834 domain-containing protein n=1 Tax=Alkalimonas cellulosilytica TaxID=3058395 RepID=A0ABU7J3A8_9GAMM|nr:hypothetical protein [Alkalimonas sp. MEB108]MEE2000912.1 hypothetical protein [Alkalimonas sp. MEB108]
MLSKQQYSMAGWAFAIYGGSGVLWFFNLQLLDISYQPFLHLLPIPFLLHVNLILMIDFLTLLCGIYLLKQHDSVHRVALPVAMINLLALPIGTMVGGLYLWFYYKRE